MGPVAMGIQFWHDTGIKPMHGLYPAAQSDWQNLATFFKIVEWNWPWGNHKRKIHEYNIHTDCTCFSHLGHCYTKWVYNVWMSMDNANAGAILNFCRLMIRRRAPQKRRSTDWKMAIQIVFYLKPTTSLWRSASPILMRAGMPDVSDTQCIPSAGQHLLSRLVGWMII